ncbi:MAG TPA: hypothetical protein HPP83_09305 [Candidatus Hydrogenedentes bacterium]|nr:hypothetical protein [Candidatus Hydrogenedentota bacterium]
MRVFRFPDRFCADSRPYWALFVFFILSIVLLVYTLYTRQPERYRRISRLFPFRAESSSSSLEAQAAAFAPRAEGGGIPLAPGGVVAARGAGSARRTVAFFGMTLRDPVVGQAARRPGKGMSSGIPVVAIDKKSISYLSGFRTGDVIVSVNRVPTRRVADLEMLARSLDPSAGILLDVFRNGQCYYMTLRL